MKTVSLVFIVIGLLLLSVGALFEFLQYPDLFKGVLSGPILIIVGIVLNIIDRLRKKRKEHSLM